MNNVDLGRYSKKFVQYFWDTAPINDNASAAPIWCLGKRYPSSTEGSTQRYPEPTEPINSAPVEVNNPADSVSSLPQDDSSPARTAAPDAARSPATLPRREQSFEEVTKLDAAQATPDRNGEPAKNSWPEGFVDDFESRLWLTYRSGFPPIPRSTDPKASAGMSLAVRLKSLAAQEGFTSDTGWGCMIRSGQCLLANSIALLRLGRDRRRGEKDSEEKEILRLFADDPHAPFSIHSFVQHGAVACGTYPGQWFGPSATARCIEALVSRHTEIGLRAYVTGDGPDVFEQTMFEIAKGDGQVFHPTLLLVGTRLGIERVTPVYREALKAAVQLPQSVGIAGGRPSASHYFVGTQDSQLFYFDPHFTRPALPFHQAASEYTSEEIDSCHTRRLRRLSIEEFDPSMLIAFLIRDEADWHDWRKRISGTSGKAIVHVSDLSPSLHGSTSEREEALDEVQTFDDDEDNDMHDDSSEPLDIGKGGAMPPGKSFGECKELE